MLQRHERLVHFAFSNKYDLVYIDQVFWTLSNRFMIISFFTLLLDEKLAREKD